ncbi:microfibril-associated glycoprotein 4-like [Gigantopelta aegis]|uniref:microfibril-associated glycoprotein 4-like n=1 Tax=Gigantopelta aegis TaxID=1735272 RepID=UPI001B88A9FA|nr:microfibril-associated glycoprotein 4-like [Gigantopelta aegis]
MSSSGQKQKSSLSSVMHNCDDVMASNPCTGSYTLTAPEVTNVTVFCDMATLSGAWLVFLHQLQVFRHQLQAFVHKLQVILHTLQAILKKLQMILHRLQVFLRKLQACLHILQVVFQRRMDGSEEFYRTWNEYKNGFGDVNREFWLGNEIIHQITRRTVYELRIELEDFEGNTRYAMYSPFSLGSEAENYTLHVASYSGDAGDALSWFSGVPFSTKDMDLDLFVSSCAELYHGAWWYTSCHSSNLNGWYLGGSTKKYATGVVWRPWKGHYYSLKRSEMKIRPVLA